MRTGGLDPGGPLNFAGRVSSQSPSFEKVSCRWSLLPFEFFYCGLCRRASRDFYLQRDQCQNTTAVAQCGQRTCDSQTYHRPDSSQGRESRRLSVPKAIALNGRTLPVNFVPYLWLVLWPNFLVQNFELNLWSHCRRPLKRTDESCHSAWLLGVGDTHRHERQRPSSDGAGMLDSVRCNAWCSNDT